VHGYYIVQHEGSYYANTELYSAAVAKGIRALTKMLSRKAVVGKTLLNQALYPVTSEQRKLCDEYKPIYQDFDDSIKRFNILSKDTLKQIKEEKSDAFPGATLISIMKEATLPLFEYRRYVFFCVRDYKKSQKYNMLPKMAVIKLCGSLYVALNAVDVRVEKPIIVALKD